MRPSFETLQDLIRACGLDLHFRLEPYDGDQDELIRACLRLSPDERLTQLEAWAELILEARERLTGLA